MSVCTSFLGLHLAALKTGGYQCLLCGKLFSIIYNAKRHIENVHESIDRRVSCHI